MTTHRIAGLRALMLSTHQEILAALACEEVLTARMATSSEAGTAEHLKAVRNTVDCLAGAYLAAKRRYEQAWEEAVSYGNVARSDWSPLGVATARPDQRHLVPVWPHP